MVDMKATTVSSALVDGFICRNGVPHTIHTDQGSQFESALFKEVCRLLDMQKTRTTPYHPAGDGLVERMNRTLESMLSARVATNHTDWDLHLQRSLLAYRCSVHSSTKETLAKLTFGRQLSLPIDIMFNDPSTTPTSVASHLEKLCSSFQLSFTHAKESGAHAQRRQKTYYDKRATHPKFATNDIVLLHSPVIQLGTSRKFHCPWKGPF